MKYTVITPKRFKKDLVRCQKRGLNMWLIYDAILLLQETGNCPGSITRISWLAKSKRHGNVIFSQIG